MKNSQEIITLGSRASKLAVSQSNIIANLIKKKYPHIKIKQKTIITTGDKKLKTQLYKLGGKGLFIKELEQSLLKKEIDIAIHSFKDIPVKENPNFYITSAGKRENPKDAFISNNYQSIHKLKKYAKIATSSLRRKVQLLKINPNLNIIPIRGNIETRLKKLETNQIDGLILATAGLIRLKLKEKITQILSPKIMIPAASQGVIAVECLSKNIYIKKLLNSLTIKEVNQCINCERHFMKIIEGECHNPVASYAIKEKDKIILTAMIANNNGSIILIDKVEGKEENIYNLAHKLVNKFIKKSTNKAINFKS